MSARDFCQNLGTCEQKNDRRGASIEGKTLQLVLAVPGTRHAWSPMYASVQGFSNSAVHREAGREN